MGIPIGVDFAFRARSGSSESDHDLRPIGARPTTAATIRCRAGSPTSA